MEFISAKEASEKWNISVRRVQVLCEQERISGAMKVGIVYIIPSNAEKPNDMRKVTRETFDESEKKKYV